MLKILTLCITQLTSLIGSCIVDNECHCMSNLTSMQKNFLNILISYTGLSISFQATFKKPTLRNIEVSCKVKK